MIGDPGSGKTVLLRQYALKLLRRRRGPLPIVLALREEPETVRGLTAALEARYGKPTADLLMARVARGRAVVLLDGLDEVGDPERAQKLVARFVGDAEGCRVVLTSRRLGYVKVGGAAELYLVPLDAGQQLTLLRQWLGDEARAISALRELAPHRKMRELATNPLLLTLVAMVVVRADGAPLPVLRTSLYEEALQYLLDRRKPPLSQRVAVRELLATIAFAAHGTADGMGLHRLVARLATERIPSDLGDAETFLRTVAERTGLLDPDPRLGPVRGYTFPHRTFQEYLAAVALARVAFDLDGAPRPWLADVIGKAARDPSTWSEVLALTCGLLPLAQADALVRAVIATESTELVYRVLGDAEQVSPEVVEEALRIDRDPKKWETRRKLLEVDLPQLVARTDEPARRVLALVEWFAGTTTHGADLYFARRVMGELAQGRCGGLEVPPELRALAKDKTLQFWETRLPRMRRDVLAALDRWGWAEVTATDYHPAGSTGTVRLVRPYEMGNVPVVNEVYALFDPSHGGDPGFPLGNVTWYEAAAFAAWLAAEPHDERRVRLPTEIEWELWADATGGSNNFVKAIESHLVPWSARPEGQGMLEVFGNISGWCADEYQSTGPQVPPQIWRGGIIGAYTPWPCRLLRPAAAPALISLVLLVVTWFGSTSALLTIAFAIIPVGATVLAVRRWTAARRMIKRRERAVAPPSHHYEYDPQEPSRSLDDPDANRVTRGGPWVGDTVLMGASFRHSVVPGEVSPERGVRLVRTPVQPPPGGP